VIFMSGQATQDIGKIGRDVFRRTIFPRLGADRGDVLVGPRHGLDAGILDLGGGRVMALSTDPFFVAPEYGWERAGWFAVQIVLSDVATSGLPPSHLAVDLNLPASMTEAELASLWESVDLACREAGVAIVTGHTGRYDECAFPMVGAATGMAIGASNGFVTPAMARPGDAVLVTKGPGLESTALLGVAAPRTLEAAVGRETAVAAAALFASLSVVRDASVAAGAGAREEGVTSMHDAAERGVLGGLVEIAEASGCGMIVDPGGMPPPPVVAAVCAYFAIDPYIASSEGTLLLTCLPARAAQVLARLEDAGIPAFRVGEMLPPENGLALVHEGRQVPLQAPLSDPFWPAYRRALEVEAGW
jgi:hydrogenase maturation factor